MTIKYSCALVFAIGGAALGGALPMGTAAAQEIVKLEAGLYTLRLKDNGYYYAGQCLIQGNNGTAVRPERYNWGQAGGLEDWCGFANETAFHGNGQGLFQVIPTTWMDKGTPGYILKNKRSGACLTTSASGQVTFGTKCEAWNNQAIWLLDAVRAFPTVSTATLKPLLFPTRCLIFGNNGRDTQPALWRWGNVSSDQRFCGLGDFWTLGNTKQAQLYLTFMGQTYTNDTDFNIPDHRTFLSPITVTGRGGMGSPIAQVAVDITHTFRADLTVELLAPGGQAYPLSKRAGGIAANIRETFTVDLSGEPMNGRWNLRIHDWAGGHTGTLNSWSLTF